MEYKDLQKADAKGLQKALEKERARVYDLRMKLAVGQLKDVRELREARKNIAQIRTRLSCLSHE